MGDVPEPLPETWEMYKKHVASFWTAEEIALSQDTMDWERLTDSERHLIKHVHAFFAASDGIVLENLRSQFSTEVQILEARAFYGFQIDMENIHSETYSLLFEQYIRDGRRRIYSFVVAPSVHSVQSVYQKYHAEVFDENGKYLSENWEDFEEKADLCGIGILCLWWATMLKEMRKNERLWRNVKSLEATKSWFGAATTSTG
jgi:ribonucleotide reductase beta subunit family protein with ferritin-like domain